MSGCTKGVALISGMILCLTPIGCLCPSLCGKPEVQAPAPVVEAPPPAPAYTYVEPAPPPPAPPQPEPKPAPLPPAVTKSIQELSEKYPDLFKFDRQKGLLYFTSDAMFDSGSATVKPVARTALGKLARILNEEEARDRHLTIIGHTDTDRVVKPVTIRTLKGLEKSVDNMGLSEARSEAVAAVLESGGVATSRINTEGRGEAEPVADNSTPTGKARNRRVEVYVTPAKGG